MIHCGPTVGMGLGTAAFQLRIASSPSRHSFTNLQNPHPPCKCKLVAAWGCAFVFPTNLRSRCGWRCKRKTDLTDLTRAFSEPGRTLLPAGHERALHVAAKANAMASCLRDTLQPCPSFTSRCTSPTSNAIPATTNNIPQTIRVHRIRYF